MKHIVFLLLSFVLVYVSTGYATIINVPTNYPAIQDAINNAVDTDTILVANGIYNEHLLINNKEIILISEYANSNDPGDIYNTIIDGGNTDRVLNLNHATGKVQGFTITNGIQSAQVGGGILIYQSAINSNDSMVVCDNVISNNSGRGVFSWTSKATFRNNMFLNNTSPHDGGGLFCYVQDSSVVIGNIFRENNSGGRGGAFSCADHCYNIVENNTLVQNVAISNGGAIYVVNNSEVWIERNIVALNSGGGINMGIPDSYSLSCNDLWNNTNGDDYINCTLGSDDISADPLFCDTTINDFHVDILSPCAPDNGPCTPYIGADTVGCNKNVTIFGILNRPLGQALLGEQGDDLIATGLSSSNDGIAAEFGTTEFGIVSINASGWGSTRHLTVAAVDTNLNTIGSLNITTLIAGITNYSIDLSPLGASTYTVSAYNDGLLVDSHSGISGLALIAYPFNTITVSAMDDGWSQRSNPGMFVTFDAPITLQITGGGGIVGDRVEFIAEGVVWDSPDDQYPSIHVTSSDLDTIRIVGEQIGMFDHRHIALGQASLTGDEGHDILGQGPRDVLIVSGLGPTGSEGVTIDYNHNAGWDIGGLQFVPPGKLETVWGSGLQFAVNVYLDGGTEETFGGASVVGNYDGVLRVVALMDYLGVSTFTAEVKDSHDRIAIGSGIPGGEIATISAAPVGFRWLNNGINSSGPSIEWMWDDNVQITIPDKGTYSGNKLIITGESPTETIDVLSTIDMTAWDIDTLIIWNEIASPDVLTLTTSDDSGPGSLRWAIDESVNNPGQDIITFDASGTISLETPLPPITDGETQILGSTAPEGPFSVILDGSGLSSGDGLSISSSNNIIEGLVITGFPDNGVIVTGAVEGNTITGNLIHDNGGLAIDLGDDGVTVNDAGDTDTGPNNLINYPEVDSVNSLLDKSYEIYGHTAAGARVDLYLAHPPGDTSMPEDPLGYGEAYAIIGTTTADGSGAYYFDLGTTVAPFSRLTSTTTDASGNTSEMAPNYYLLPRPMIITAFVYNPAKGGDAPQNGINIMVTDPNGDRFGLDENNVLIDEIPGDQFYFITASEDDSLVIPEPVIGEYTIDIIGSGDGATGSMYASIIKVDGSLECILIVDGDIPATGNFTSFSYTYDEDEAIYTNGDANGDWECNVGDAVFIINYVFNGGPPPVPVLAGDANCSGDVNVGDAVYVINYVFKGGDPPCYLPF